MYNNSNPFNNNIVLQYQKMAPTNLIQPRLPTTPFEIHVLETQLWVSLLLMDPPTYFFVDMCSISIRDSNTFSLTKIELYINMFGARNTPSDLGESNSCGIITK